jgi:hypothetical protein
MRLIPVISFLIVCCYLWATQPAHAAHTITPPGLPRGFGDTASDTVDPGTPQWSLGDKLVKAFNAGDVGALTNLVNLKGLATRVFPELRRNPRASRYVDDNGRHARRGGVPRLRAPVRVRKRGT